MNLTDALTSAAKGAAAGAVAGPVGAAVGGLGGLVVDLAPEVGRWLFGAAAGRTAGLVTQAVEAATGTADAQASVPGDIVHRLLPAGAMPVPAGQAPG